MSEHDEPELPRSRESDAELEIFREPESGPEASKEDSGAVEGRQPPVRVIAVAGAKGGVGKTLLAANLALYLASLGRRVLILDADAEGANTHTFLGLERRAPALAGGAAVAVGSRAEDSEPVLSPVTTAVPGLRLVHGGVDEPADGRGRRATRRWLLERVRELDAEYVVVDLGSGTHPSLLDFWLAADLSLFVGVPEPTAIENSYRFIRAAFARYLCAAARDAGAYAEVRRVLKRLHHAPSPLDLARRLEGDGDPLAQLVRQALESFVFRMVLNQTRLRADLELGDRMRSAARRRLGVRVDYLGYIDYDDTAWTCVRMRRPLLVESPGTKASRSIEKIARRVLAIDSGKTPARPLRTVPPETHHDLLEVDRGATDEEVRRAYKRAKDVYAPDALCCYGLFDKAALEALRARLDEAYDVLLDPARRRPYELSVFPPEPERDRDRPRIEASKHPKPPAPVITPDTEFTGALIRAVRESQGVDVCEIAQHTKIGTGYLRAIEEDDFGGLPAAVYVRGFVTELGKYLKLDPEQVARTYVRRYRRYLEE